MISNSGGTMPSWSADSKEIFYISTDGKLMAVAVTTDATFEASSPVALFDAPVRPHPTRQYDVSRDGRRFLLNRLAENSSAEPVMMIQNWDLKFSAK